jgi:hypothetical protein
MRPRRHLVVEKEKRSTYFLPRSFFTLYSIPCHILLLHAAAGSGMHEIVYGACNRKSDTLAAASGCSATLSYCCQG